VLAAVPAKKVMMGVDLAKGESQIVHQWVAYGKTYKFSDSVTIGERYRKEYLDKLREQMRKAFKNTRFKKPVFNSG
jgi:vancomycin resistance protein YoaR